MPANPAVGAPFAHGPGPPHPAKFLPPAAVAELVDAQASGACVLRDVEVRVLSAAWGHLVGATSTWDETPK